MKEQVTDISKVLKAWRKRYDYCVQLSISSMLRLSNWTVT